VPSKSQDQQRFFSFVRACQENKASAKGYPKVEEAAKEMKPESVEHFMSNNGHIDKSLPKTAEAFERGMFKAALAQGISPLQAAMIVKQAMPAGLMEMIKNNPELVGALGGGAVGAGIGGLAGGRKGAVGGGLTGLAAGGMLGHSQMGQDWLAKMMGGGQVTGQVTGQQGMNNTGAPDGMNHPVNPPDMNAYHKQLKMLQAKLNEQGQMAGLRGQAPATTLGAAGGMFSDTVSDAGKSLQADMGTAGRQIDQAVQAGKISAQHAAKLYQQLGEKLNGGMPKRIDTSGQLNTLNQIEALKKQYN
jgi:hypothetical protein